MGDGRQGRLGWNASIEEIMGIIRRGELGMDEFCNWIEKCVRVRGSLGHSWRVNWDES